MEDTRPSLGNTGVLLIMFYKVFCVVILKADLLKIFGSCHPTDPKNYLECMVGGSECPFSTSCFI